MVAVCNFSNLFTLIIFNGFSLQADGGAETGSSAACAGGSHAPWSLAALRILPLGIVGSGQSFSRELLSHL